MGTAAMRERAGILALALAAVFAAVFASAPAGAQDASAQWWANLEACSETNRPACDTAVTLAAQLFERTDRNVATTWMKACLAGDTDRCEIGYRRFRETSFPGDPYPISHMFARGSCFGGIYDLCRPWDDFETTDEDARALVMANVCLQGASFNTCNQALAHFRHEKGLYNTVTGDLAEAMCGRNSPSACRVLAEVLELNWDHRRAYFIHKSACENGLQASCSDAARLKGRVDYENAQITRAEEAERQRLAAIENARTYRAQLSSRGYVAPERSGAGITPFGSSPGDIANWQRFQRNLCLGNPTSTRC